jgi:hypothetical protein
LRIKPLPLEKEGRGQFTPAINADAFGAVFRIVGYYIKETREDIVRIKTYYDKVGKEDAIGKKLSTLKINNSTRYQEKSFRDENWKGKS